MPEYREPISEDPDVEERRELLLILAAVERNAQIVWQLGKLENPSDASTGYDFENVRLNKINDRLKKELRQRFGIQYEPNHHTNMETLKAWKNLDPLD